MDWKGSKIVELGQLLKQKRFDDNLSRLFCPIRFICFDLNQVLKDRLHCPYCQSSKMRLKDSVYYRLLVLADLVRYVLLPLEKLRKWARKEIRNCIFFSFRLDPWKNKNIFFVSTIRKLRKFVARKKWLVVELKLQFLIVKLNTIINIEYNENKGSGYVERRSGCHVITAFELAVRTTQRGYTRADENPCLHIVIIYHGHYELFYDSAMFCLIEKMQIIVPPDRNRHL